MAETDLRILNPRGALRREAAEELVDHAEELLGGSGAIVIDLSAVETIDSSGLNSLINVVTRARLRDIRVVLVGPNSFVAGVLQVTRLDEWFEIFPSLDEARSRIRET